MPKHLLSFSIHMLPQEQKVEGSSHLSGHAICLVWANKGTVVQRSAARIIGMCFISGASYALVVRIEHANVDRTYLAFYKSPVTIAQLACSMHVT